MFRAAMTWVHTWVGLVLGYVLMVVFFFGSLSVFDREIDRWTMPTTRVAAEPMPSWERVLAPAFERVAHGRRITSASAFRTNRDPITFLYTDLAERQADGTEKEVDGPETMLDARTGEPLPEGTFPVGSRFFYPMHLHLHLQTWRIGEWIVGAAAMTMLLALLSGVVIHRKLFAELFTFRPQKSLPRATLDLHDVTGVLGLPFHLFFAFTGLVVFAGIYLPVGQTVLKPIAKESDAAYPRAAANAPAPLASVDAMVAEAKRRWTAQGNPGEPGYVLARFPGDANASVSVYRSGTDRVSMFTAGVHFEGTTGRVLSEDHETRTSKVTSFLTALHLQPFEQWTLRWLYFAGGLAGCVCIATGMVLFVHKRARKHPQGARVANAAAVGTVTGTVVATLAMLVANRVAQGHQQAIFWAAWLAAFVHGARRRRAWREQCWAIAALASLAVILNAATTPNARAVYRVDLVLLGAAGAAWFASRRLRDA